MSDIILRKAVTTDGESIARVHVNSWKVAYVDLMPEHVIASRPLDLRIQQWTGWIKNNPEGIIWLAEKNDRVLGFVSGGPTRGEHAAIHAGEIYALYIDPSAFRKGVGQLLFQKMRDILISKGYLSHMVWVMENNSGARAFYEKQGGKIFAQTKIQMGDPPVEIQEVAYRYTSC